MQPATTLKEYRSATRAMFDLSSFNNPLAVTLTLKPFTYSQQGINPLTPDLASQNLRHFIKQLSRKILMRSQFRSGRRIPCYPAYESRDVTPHYHLALDRPDHISLEGFTGMVAVAWHKTQFGNRQIDIRPCDKGWIRYITKLRTKDNFINSIDWNNCHRPDSAV